MFKSNSNHQSIVDLEMEAESAKDEGFITESERDRLTDLASQVREVDEKTEEFKRWKAMVGVSFFVVLAAILFY